MYTINKSCFSFFTFRSTNTNCIQLIFNNFFSNHNTDTNQQQKIHNTFIYIETDIFRYFN